MTKRNEVYMTSELAKKECVPCKGGTPPLPKDQIQALLGELDEWTVQQEYHLTKSFDFPDFVMALDFVNRIGEIAEQQQRCAALTGHAFLLGQFRLRRSVPG